MDHSISRTQSLHLKGIAILMMLLLHLFNTEERVGECVTYVNFINGKPLVYALARAAGLCVPIYLFVSGYGFSLASDFSPARQWARFRQLYGRYVLALVVFVGMGAVIVPDRYPGSASELLLNLSALSCSYNEEWWFLFPYLVILLTARWTSAFVRSLSLPRAVALFLLLLAVSVSCQTWMPRTFGRALPLQLLYNLGATLPAFHAGCMVATFPRQLLRRGPVGQSVIVAAIVAILFLKMCVGTSRVNVLFAVPAILLFVRLSLPRSLAAVLAFFGRYSTFMWLTHTFYAYYLFHDVIYGLRHPLLMYCVLVAVSCVTAILLERASRMLLK